MELCGRNVRLDRSAAGMAGRGRGKGGSHHFVPYHPSGDFGMYSGNFRGPMYPPTMMPHHIAQMYPAVPYGFAAQAAGGRSTASGAEEDDREGQHSGGPPPPPPPPPQFMFHPMVGHPYHPMVGMPAYAPQVPVPPAPPAPPSANAE
jgi:hypothetical protein